MKQYHLRALIITFLVVLIGIALYFYVNQKKEEPVAEQPAPTRPYKEIYNFDRSKCPGDEISFVVPDPYMRGIVEQGQTIRVVMNYYACNNLKRGDIVMYKYSSHEDPVIRRVVGVPGDTFRLKSVVNEGWELYVNERAVTGVKGQVYRFGVDKYNPPLELAQKQRQGRLPEKELIVLSAFPPGDRDSGLFGLTNQTDIVGKVVTSSEEKK